MSNYYASKAYVLHFSEGLREELKAHGVGVSVLCPGPTQSASFGHSQLSTAHLENGKLMSAEEVALYTIRTLEKNRAIIIPGWRNRLLAMAPRILPRWLTRKLAARINQRCIQVS